MKNLFHGFYELSDADEKEMFLNEKTLFIFDTNCFFNLYRCENNTRKEVMKTIECVKDRIWFPFQVCFEYQRNRLSVIKNSLIDFNNIESDLNKIIQILGSLCGEKLGFQGKYENLHSDLCILRDDIKKEINKFITEKIKLKSAENDYISKSDEVRKWLEVLSENRIGKPLTQEQVDKINKIGERRYKYKVGPGWGDDNKKQEYFFNGVFYSAKYGDLYIWNEILNKSESEDVSSIVFITNDEKSDWWYKIDQCDDAYGPLEVLKTELMSRGNCRFKMYKQTSFLQAAEKHYNNVKIKSSTLKEIDDISKSIFEDGIKLIIKSPLKTEENKSKNIYYEVYKYMNSPQMKALRSIQETMGAFRKQIEIIDEIKKLQGGFDFIDVEKIMDFKDDADSSFGKTVSLANNENEEVNKDD